MKIVDVKCETIPIAKFVRDKCRESSEQVRVITSPDNPFSEVFQIEPLQANFRKPIGAWLLQYGNDVVLRLQGKDEWLSVREFLRLDESEFN